MGRFVTFGEIMFRFNPEGYLRIVQATKFEASLAGGEANVAVSLANYGEDAAFLTVLPDNAIADACKAELRRFDVDTKRIVTGEGRMGIYYLEGGANQRPSKVVYDRAYSAIALAKPGDKVSAASWLGQVKEEWVEHKIMVPFTMEGTYTVKSVVPAGEYKVTDTIAVITDADGRDHDITMVQRWPVKQAVRCYREKPRPSRVMETGVRAIDTFNPLAEGGTGFIPGPFGAGKTVLQHAISKQADADVIIIVACGERANEVVEIFKEFPELVDPRTGHKLMERTIIICNTSNMPVAAREASVYTGMTIGEYYRSMGLKVLVMADSTSRWAQALREMSNRLEELPGQDAFPVDLSAIISNFYARAGLVKLSNGKTGSVTFLGTVSPAGGS